MARYTLGVNSRRCLCKRYAKTRMAAAAGNANRANPFAASALRSFAEEWN
jgi:hypothetical protein